MSPAWWLIAPVVLLFVWWLVGRAGRLRRRARDETAAPSATSNNAAPASTVLLEPELDTQAFAATTLMPHSAEDAALIEIELAKRSVERQLLLEESERVAAAELAALQSAAAAAEELQAQRAAEAQAEREAAEAETRRIEAETQLRREAIQAEARRQAAAAETRRQAEEAEHLRAAEEAEAHRQAEEAERLRAADDAAAAEALLPPAPPTPAVERHAAQTLVMVVDDSKVVRVKTSRLLEKHHFRVTIAENGEQALAQILGEMPQVLITDVEMPGIDGVELTRRLRADARTATLPVIMITSADDRMRDIADEVGVSVLLGKPYADEALVSSVQQLAGVTVPAVP